MASRHREQPVAMYSFVPYAPARDLMMLREIYDLLAQTDHPAPKSVIEGWIKRERLDTVKHRGKVHVSYSDILLAHRDAVAAGEI